METAKDDIQRVTETLKDEVGKLNEVVAMAPTGTGEVGGCQHDGAHGGITYTDVLNRQLPAAHLSTLARGWVKDRQVLIDKDPVAELNQLACLNECELVAKANEALTHMATKVQQGLEELREVGAKKLNNGGIVYNLDKMETASWVRREKNAFMARFGGTAVVRDRATSVMVEFVPVVHSPDALAENRRIKRNSRLKDGSLTSTRWIKPLQRCALGQKAAHLIVCFKTNMAANEAIKERMVIAGKRVWARQI